MTDKVKRIGMTEIDPAMITFQKRVTAKDIRSKEVAFWHFESFIPTVPGGSTLIFTFDKDTGIITINGKITFTNQILGIQPEIRLELVDTVHFTTNNNYEPIGWGTNQYPRMALNSTEWDPDIFQFYYEINANGDGGFAVKSELYNITDGASVSNTEVTGTTTDASTRVRSTTPFTLTSGIKEYIARMKRNTSGSGSPAIGEAAIVVRLKGLGDLGTPA